MKETAVFANKLAMGRRLLVAAALAMALTLPLFAQETGARAKDASASKQEKQSETDTQKALVREAAQLASAGRTQDALSKVDEALEGYRARFANQKGRIYSIRDSAEALLYMAMAANDKRDAIAVEFEYGFAWYLRGYLLVEQQRLDDALASLNKAAELSPMNSQYLSEAAHIHQGRENWTEALALYESAEAYSEFSGDEEQQHKARALRGQGFVLARIDRFEEAEKAYRDALAIDPADARAKTGLKAVDELRERKQTSI